MTEQLKQLCEQFQKLTYREMMVFSEDLADAMKDAVNQGEDIDALMVAEFISDATQHALRDEETTQ